MHDIDALLDSHDGVALAALVRRGEIRPLELADAAIARLERVSALKAVAETLYDQARAAARLPAATQGALAGVPTFAQLIEDFHSYCPFTALFNASGQPAMSVPLYWSPAGLPIGAHFAARFGEETTLLALAAQLERAHPWAARVPALDANAARR